MKLNLELDPSGLTLGEITDLETIATFGALTGPDGQPPAGPRRPILQICADLRAFAAGFEKGDPDQTDLGINDIIAVLFVLQRRTDPTVTVEAIRNLRLADLEYESTLS